MAVSWEDMAEAAADDVDRQYWCNVCSLMNNGRDELKSKSNSKTTEIQSYRQNGSTTCIDITMSTSVKKQCTAQLWSVENCQQRKMFLEFNY